MSCPAEITLVRISNDTSLPPDQRRNYKGIHYTHDTHYTHYTHDTHDTHYTHYTHNAHKGVVDAFVRITKEEGPKAFYRGSAPFVNRAMVVGAVQVGTFDQFKTMFKSLGGPSQSAIANTFYASMASGLIYSLATMPLETTKNRMAFQQPDPLNGKLPYISTVQSIGKIVRDEGLLSLWAGFPPYYLRCGGHTVFMFMSIEWLRKTYRNMQ